MVEYESTALDNAFYALSDSTRRALLVQLSKKECTVSELAEPFRLTLAAVSKHLKVLEDAKFVIKKREGRTFRCQINPTAFRDVSELLKYFEQFWNTQLDALEKFLTEPKKDRNKSHERKRKNKHRSKARRKTRH